MKIAFQVPTADLALAAIQFENQYFLVSDILPILERCVMVDNPGVGTTSIYLTMRKLIQSAGTYNAPTFTVSANWQRLDNDQVETWKNFQNGVTINKFVKGTTYLIPAEQFAALNMIPNFMSLIRAISGQNFAGTTYRFDCGEDTDILNDTDIPGVIACEFLGQAALEYEAVKAPIKKREQTNLLLATGVNPQVVQLLNAPSGNMNKPQEGKNALQLAARI